MERFAAIYGRCRHPRTDADLHFPGHVSDPILGVMPPTLPFAFTEQQVNTMCQWRLRYVSFRNSTSGLLDAFRHVRRFRVIIALVLYNSDNQRKSVTVLIEMTVGQAGQTAPLGPRRIDSA